MPVRYWTLDERQGYYSPRFYLCQHCCNHYILYHSEPYRVKNLGNFFPRYFGLLFRFWFRRVSPHLWVGSARTPPNTFQSLTILVPVHIKEFRFLSSSGQIIVCFSINNICDQVCIIRQWLVIELHGASVLMKHGATVDSFTILQFLRSPQIVISHGIPRWCRDRLL